MVEQDAEPDNTDTVVSIASNLSGFGNLLFGVPDTTSDYNQAAPATAALPTSINQEL